MPGAFVRQFRLEAPPCTCDWPFGRCPWPTPPPCFPAAPAAVRPASCLPRLGWAPYSASASAACLSVAARASAAEQFRTTRKQVSVASQRLDALGLHAFVGAACREILVLLGCAAGPINYQPVNFFPLPQSKSKRQFRLRQVT